MTSGKLIEDNATSYIPKGDSLKITFTPNEKYRKCNFNVKYSIIDPNSEVKEISNLYVSKGNDGSKIVMEANGDFTSNDTIYHLSAIREYTFLSPSKINYALSVSPDLLLFVTPEISYEDDEGVTHTMQITEEMMTTEHVTNEKMGIERNYCNWEKEIRYLSWNIDCGMSVKYIPKDNVILTKDAYELHQGFGAQSGQSNGISITLNITIGNNKKTDDGRILKEYVQEYIDQLVDTPQSIRFHIDEKGNIARIKE